MTAPAFKLLKPKNNVTVPTLVGSIGASDVTIALTTGHGASFPTISRATASSTGDARTLNSTGNLAAVAVGDWLYNLTDESWAQCTVAGTNSITTTPLEGGTLNVWTSGDVVILSGMFVATITQYSGSTIVKQERVLVTNRATDTLTVVRGFDSDTSYAFNALDSVQILVEQGQILNLQYAIRNVIGKIDALHRGVPFSATATGSANAYAVTYAPVITSYASIAGLPLIFHANFSVTGATTVNINGLGAKNLKKEGGATALASNDITTNMPVAMIYNATLDCMVMLSPPANAPATSTETVTDKTADFTILSASGLNAYTNTGASQHILFTLPASPTAGTVIDFLVTTAKGVGVLPNSGQTLNYSSNGGVAAIFTDVQYSAFRCIAYSTTLWMVQNVVGTWLSGTQIGFICGGNGGADSAVIDKFTVATTPTCAAHTATLDAARSRVGGCSSWFAGYICGGDIAATDQSTISKMSFAAETEANIAATLDNAREQDTHCMQNKNTKGYVCGGGVTTSSAQIDYINFADDTSVDLGTDLTASRQGAAVVENLDVAGYYMGGASTAIDKLVYSGETVSAIAAVLPAAKLSQIPVWSGTKGYACGGNGGPIATIQALTYSGETVAQNGTNLPAAREDGMGISSTLNGYVTGGGTAIYAMLFSAETWTTPSAVLSASRSYGASIQTPKR